LTANQVAVLFFFSRALLFLLLFVSQLAPFKNSCALFDFSLRAVSVFGIPTSDLFSFRSSEIDSVIFVFWTKNPVDITPQG
jgi:hypothetical protein